MTDRTVPDSADRFAALRDRMVRQQIEARGVRDARILAAMRAVPRHAFVPADQREYAYEDSPLPIGAGQTISQPYIVAYMTEALELGEKQTVLEIGTGSGYQTAVLACLVKFVYSVERIPALASQARDNLAAAGVVNVEVICGDGSLGLAEHAPYDAILVTAGAPAVPQMLLDQLAQGGRLLAPVGGRSLQELELWRRTGDRIERRELIQVVFVPLVGAHGWKPE
jgi:protein-L-isoaspartate(D-aspartate) O-methyltransferase